MDKRLVYNWKRTGISYAPDEIVRCINKYSDKYRAVLTIENYYPPDYLVDPNIPVITEVTTEELNKADIVHFHNLSQATDTPSTIHYHSPPGTPMDLDYRRGPRMVVDQYHMFLPLYKGCEPVRIILDIYDESYNQKEISDKIKIGFAPSTPRYSRGNRSYESKAFIETEEILLNIKAKYDVEIDIIHGVPLSECLERKSKCNILIAECIGDSYHRSGLENLALGKHTICSLGDNVIGQIINKTGCKKEEIPFANIWLEQLEAYLSDIIENKGVNWVLQDGKISRKWMETYWTPQQILKDYEFIYDRL